MAVPDFAGKPSQHQWCAHARPGSSDGGCTIYNLRPEECRAFRCMWLIDNQIPDYWKPDKAKIVISPHLAEAHAYVGFVVDPAYPNRWREEPWFSDIKVMAKAGLKGLGRLGRFEEQKWTTVVLVGDERIPILG
jgi:hypothetical protein